VALSFNEGMALGGSLGDLVSQGLDAAGWTKKAQARARNDAIFNGGLASLIQPTPVAQNAAGMTGANGGGQATLARPTPPPVQQGGTADVTAVNQAKIPDPARRAEVQGTPQPTRPFDTGTAAAPALPSPQPAAQPAAQSPQGAFGSNIPTQTLVGVLRDENSSDQDRAVAKFLLEPRMKGTEYSFLKGEDGTIYRTTSAGNIEKVAGGSAGAYRPANAAEKQAYGVTPDAPLVFGPDGKPQILSAGGTTVNVAAGEKAQDQAVGKAYGERFVDLQKAGGQAQSTLNTFGAMKKLTADPKFRSGAGSSYQLAFDKALVALGGDPNSTASRESFKALASKAVLDGLGGSLGAGVSNADVGFIQGTVPTLDNSPDGIKLLIDIQSRLAQRQKDIAKLARDYKKGNGGKFDEGFDQALANYAEQNPLFADLQVPNTTAPPPSSTGAPAPIRKVIGGRVYEQDPGTGQVFEVMP
jgi:hypothetical protein